MNKSKIIRSYEPFNLICNKIKFDENLISDAKHLLLNCLFNSEKVVIYIENEYKNTGLSLKKGRLAKKNIINAGYLIEKKLRGGMSYIFYEQPIQ